MDLGSTAYVIMGLLDGNRRTGYEIKQIVDRSTRFFWAASYGQIYPELRRLEAEGLVRRTEPSRKGLAPKAEGGRARKQYGLTATGRRELQAWLRRPPELLETRDEALLKLFFAASLPETAPRALDHKRRLHAEKLAQLRAIEPAVAEHATPYQLTTLRFGIALSEFCMHWCEEALEQLKADEKGNRRQMRTA